MSLLLLFHPRHVQETSETATVYLDLVPVGTEVHVGQLADQAVVYLDLQVYSLQIYGILEIIGNVRRWNTLTIYRRYSLMGLVVRWEQGLDEMLRWTIMNVRRFLWRS
jgi:hypothetical protein